MSVGIEFRIGTASWTDPSLINLDLFYPTQNAAEKRTSPDRDELTATCTGSSDGSDLRSEFLESFPDHRRFSRTTTQLR
jgi:hypothetical protein